jgi:hypothetical protein
MGAPVRESDDGKASKSEPKNEPAKNAPSRNERSKAAPKDVGAAPSSRATEAPAPPWKRKPRRGVFEGDVAVLELRSRLALGSERIPEPAEPISTAPASSGILRLMSGIAMAAAVAGVVGYFCGFRLSSKTPEPALASGQADVLQPLSTPVAGLNTSNRDSEPPTRTAAVGLAPSSPRGTANPVTSVDAAQRPAPLPPLPRFSAASAPRPPVHADDASEVAAKMKIGAELMAHGDITAARTMFERAAEAGEAAGAFALAETYDPVVLGRLRLRGGITPDLALARTWYEKARDLGSLAARDRISRLAQLSQ